MSIRSYSEQEKQELLEAYQVSEKTKTAYARELSFDGEQFGHTLVIVNIKNKFTLRGIKIASHTFDSFDKAIAEYNFQKIRWIHIEKVK